MKEILRPKQQDASRRYARSRKGQQGQSFIEFSLIVPILFLMLIGVAFIAQGLNLQMVLYGAAYEGARIWAKNPAGGDSNHCTPPACDPSTGDDLNFDKYIIPTVQQYITKNGFIGEKVVFFTEDKERYKKIRQYYSNFSQSVTVVLLYPIELPVGNFAGG